MQDGLKGLQITYNILNLPQTVTQSGTTKATYGWFADGTKYSVLDAQGNGYHYIGSLIYSSTAGTTVLESTDFSGGRIVMNGSAQTIHYHHKDHLGSVRAITDNAGAVIEQNAYYPFGGRHTFGQTYVQIASNRYKFNGKELQTIGNLDLLDYGARMYDTKIGRWLVQDPLAEKYFPLGAYSFSGNNPVMNIDRDGKAWDVFVDVASLVYDVGSAIYNHAKGNHSLAKQNWVDVAIDASSMIIPGVAAPMAKGLVKGIDKAADAGKGLKNANAIAEGKNFGKQALEEARANGLKVEGEIRLVPDNGKGNIKGNRTTVDQLIQNDDGTYTIVETKLRKTTPLSKRQKRAKKNVEEGNKMFEVRSKIESFGLKPGMTIEVTEFKRINKYE